MNVLAHLLLGLAVSLTLAWSGVLAWLAFSLLASLFA
jgi:hypothetical protein